MSDQLQIGEVAKLFEVTTKTIRHYEKLGLLRPERADNDYRLYGPEDVLTIQRIRQLQTLGLSLKQIKKILTQDEDIAVWETVLATLLQDTQQEIKQLQRRQKQLQELLEEGITETMIGPPVQSTSTAEVYAYLAQHLPTSAQAQWHQEQTVFTMLHTMQHYPTLQTAVLRYLATVPNVLTQLQTIAGQMELLPYGYIDGGYAPYALRQPPLFAGSPAEVAWPAAGAPITKF